MKYKLFCNLLNILKQNYGNENDLCGCRFRFPAGFAKDTYSYNEYFKRYGRFEYHQNRRKICFRGQMGGLGINPNVSQIYQNPSLWPVDQ